MPKNRDYLKRMAAALNTVMKAPDNRSGFDRKPTGNSKRKRKGKVSSNSCDLTADGSSATTYGEYNDGRKEHGE